jgi:CTP synthase (UTP-ammonia lyase)
MQKGKRSAMRYVALLGEFTPTFKPHVATNAAIKHTCAALDLRVEGEWVSTQHIGHSLFSRYAGIWVAPGSPYKNLERTLWAIEHARTNNIPCFGTCGGFQHMVLEYARNVLHFSDAQHAEYDPYASALFITQLACSLAGREMTLQFVAGSKVAKIYGALSAKEEYYCDFGVDPGKAQLLTSGALRVTGSDGEGEIRVIELPEHPFFVGTLYVPQTRSTQAAPHPLVNAFLTVISHNVVPAR